MPARILANILMRTAGCVLSVAMLVTSVPVAVAADMGPSPQGSYAVVVSKKTYADKDWRTVAETLRAKYGGRIITWDSGVAETSKDLAAWMPNYTCFVGQPEEADCGFVVAVRPHVKDVCKRCRAIRPCFTPPVALPCVPAGITQTDSQDLLSVRGGGPGRVPVDFASGSLSW